MRSGVYALLAAIVVCVGYSAPAMADDYMGHCSRDGGYTPEEVISACENFIDHVFKENWKGEYLPDAYYNMGLAHKAHGDVGAAKKDFALAVRYAPAYFAAWRQLVETMTNLTGADSSAKAVDLMVAAHPNDASVLNEACWIRATGSQQLQLALAECSQAVGFEPQNGAFLNSRGFVEFRLADYAGAIKDNTAALAARPNDSDSLYIRGLAKLKIGQAADGNADIAAAKAITPGIADTYAKYGVAP